MPNPEAIRIVSGVSTVLGLVALLGYFYTIYQAKGAERSVRAVIDESGLVIDADQVVKILAALTTDEARIEALKHVLSWDRRRAEDLLAKVKADVSVKDLHRITNRRNIQLALIGGFVFLLLGSIGLISTRDGWSQEPDTDTAETLSSDTASTTGSTAPDTAATHTNATDVTDTSTANRTRFPIYVTPEMITACRSRGNLCGTDRPVKLGDLTINRGVIYTQNGPRTHGTAYAKFPVPEGARFLRFVVGNYAEPCEDPHKTPMNVKVLIDGVEKWPVHSVEQVWRDSVTIPAEAQLVELRGETTDGPFDCDDAVWGDVRFDQ